MVARSGNIRRNSQMTDTDLVQEDYIAAIPVRGKCGTVEINFDKVPMSVYKEMLYLGAEAYINKQGMAKIAAGLTKLEGEALAEAKAKVLAQAQKNVDNMLSGQIKLHDDKGKKAGVSGKVQTEALRLAKDLVKSTLKAAGLKISHYKASEITKFAKLALDSNPELIKRAEENLAQREASVLKGFDVSALKVDPDRVAKAEEKKAKKKAPGLTAKQAGMPVPPRQRPGTRPTAH